MIDGLKINRILDISLLKDRKELYTSCKTHPELLSLIDDYLDEYLTLFPEPDWHKVGTGGFFYLVGFDIDRVLQLTRTLKNLSQFKGFNNLISGFKNPSQIHSTYFETIVADWCTKRKISLSIEFSPKVSIKDKYKYPEFLWYTKLGDLFCECKRENLRHNKFVQRVNNLLSYLSKIYDSYDIWDSSLRLDVRFEGGTTNKIQIYFKSIIAQAAEAVRIGKYKGQIFREGSVSACLQRLNEPTPKESESIMTGLARVGTVAKKLTDVMYLTLTMSLAKYSQENVVRLLRDAKTQLPANQKSAVFIETTGEISPQNRLRLLLSEQSYVNIPWVSLWKFGHMTSAVWRTNQPFDETLLIEKD